MKLIEFGYILQNAAVFVNENSDQFSSVTIYDRSYDLPWTFCDRWAYERLLRKNCNRQSQPFDRILSQKGKDSMFYDHCDWQSHIFDRIFSKKSKHSMDCVRAFTIGQRTWHSSNGLITMSISTNEILTSCVRSEIPSQIDFRFEKTNFSVTNSVLICLIFYS